MDDRRAGFQGFKTAHTCIRYQARARQSPLSMPLTCPLPPVQLAQFAGIPEVLHIAPDLPRRLRPVGGLADTGPPFKSTSQGGDWLLRRAHMRFDPIS